MPDSAWHPVVASLARARASLAAFRETYGTEWREFQAANAVLIGVIADQQREVKRLETEARALALDAYNATEDKHPFVGLGIRETTMVSYPPQRAFEWAKEHDSCLTLNEDAFEALMKATPEAGRPGWVEVKKVAAPTISRELPEPPPEDTDLPF